MEPFREIGWEIYIGDFPIWVLVYVFAIIALGVMGYAIYERYHLWHMGKGEDRLTPIVPRTWEFIKTAVVDGLFHWRFSVGLREIYPGLIHFLLFSGSGLLLLGAALDFISHYWIEFLTGNVYLAISCMNEVGGILVILGIILALVRRYLLRPDRLDNQSQDWIALSLMFVIVISGFILEGFRIAAAASEEPGVLAQPEWTQWSFLGFGFYKAFAGLGPTTKVVCYEGMWWFHVVFTFGVAAYFMLSFTKLSHIFAAPLNAFLRSMRPKGALKPMPNLEELETFGVSKVEDFTWKQLMDLDACTRCGRCQDNCPAYLSGKPLSPMKMVQDIRSAMLERKDKGSDDEVRGLIGEVMTDDEIWSCTTCRSCQEHCPVFVEHIDKIIDMRRSLVMEQAKMPETVGGTLSSIETRGHPWRGANFTKTDWYKDMDIKVLSEDSNADILYWVGCTEAVDPRAMKIAKAMVNIMNTAGVDFGVLGEEESCCGEPARRMGNEYQFQLQAEQNIETLNKYGVNKIVTACPHCFNTLKNEYPQFGGNFEVVHHTQFIDDLLKQGKLKPLPIYRRGKKVTSQDPCYLTRYNDVWDSPRAVLLSIPHLKFTEMDHKKNSGFHYREGKDGLTSLIPPLKLWRRARQKEGAFCCGGGGGRSWMEETGTRISYIRTDDAIRTNCEVIATACPFCMLMLEDGVKAREVEESMQVMDIAELIAEEI